MHESFRELARQASRRQEVRRSVEQAITRVGRCQCGKDAIDCLIEFLQFYAITGEWS